MGNPSAGWHLDPDDAAMARWWDGQAWSDRRQPTVAIACGRCGAGHRLPYDYPGYQCVGCGATRHFYLCPNAHCSTTTDVDLSDTTAGQTACNGCGKKFWIVEWRPRPSTAGAAVGEGTRGWDAELSDPRRRLVGGLVTAASMIPWVFPNSLCILRFISSHVSVMAVGNGQIVEACQIGYSSVDSLEVSGAGKRTYRTGGGFSGGGFGLKGALEGMAIATILNSLTERSSVVHDTVVNLRAGERQILMNTYTFEPAFLQVLLAPVYGRINAARHGALPSPPTPAGWYQDPTQPTQRRYWDGATWTGSTAP